MKTLLIRPGTEIVEKTLKGPWPPQLSHLEKMYSQPGPLFRGFVQAAIFSHPSTLAVGTAMRKLGEDVEFLDIPLEFGVPLTEELNKQRLKKIEAYIARGKYDVVGISCLCASESLSTWRVADAAKKVSEDIAVVVGGYHPTANTLDLMEKIPAIDVIVVSDFEPVARKLLEALEGKIPFSEVPNIMYRDNGRIKTTERKHIKVEPADLPVYDYKLVEKYIPAYAIYTLETSRGCPYDCSFCQEKVMRQSYSVKDAAVAVEEFINTTNYIAQFVKTILFFYSDPLWGLNTKWVKAFCSQLAERKDEIAADLFGWSIETRIGQFEDETLSLIKKAGCIGIAYGVESLSVEMIRIMKKTKDPQGYISSVFETVDKTLKKDIETVLYFILGTPGETPETVKESLGLIKKLPLEKDNLHVVFSLAHALSGTLMDNQIHDPEFVKAHGTRILDEFDWEKGYIPRLSVLFDPSRTLSASRLVEQYIDVLQGKAGIPVIEKQFELFKTVRTILSKDQVSAEELARWSQFYRKLEADHLKGKG